MKTKSAKAKGRKLLAEVRELLFQYAPDLKPDDIRVTPSGCVGEDLLLSPAARQIYSIIVEGKVTDNKKLYKGKIFISNSTSGIVVAEQYYETHFLQVMDLRLTYKATVSLATEFTVTVEFEDHGLNKATQTLNVKVNP